jgi:hypothetical protein
MSRRRFALVRDYAVLLARTSKENPPAPSRLTLTLVEAEYDNVREDVLINEAKAVLRAARLTALTVTTKAEAVAVIRGVTLSKTGARR